MELFTSFEGRISRKTFWFGMVIVIVVSIAIILALGLQAIDAGFFSRILMLLLSVALLYPIGAVMVKRLHDRNKAAMPWVVIFFAPGILLNFLRAFGIGYTSIQMGEISILVPTGITLALSWLSMAVGIWVFIELGCLRGTSGSNNFGADPLATGSVAPETANS